MTALVEESNHNSGFYVIAERRDEAIRKAGLSPGAPWRIYTLAPFG
jgi:hypothetical protein